MTQFSCGSGGRRPPLRPGSPGADLERQVDEINQEIAELASERERCQETALDLLAREQAGEGPFAREIFELKQQRLRLATEIQHLKVRINHLIYGVAPTRGGS